MIRSRRRPAIEPPAPTAETRRPRRRVRLPAPPVDAEYSLLSESVDETPSVLPMGPAVGPLGQASVAQPADPPTSEPQPMPHPRPDPARATGAESIPGPGVPQWLTMVLVFSTTLAAGMAIMKWRESPASPRGPKREAEVLTLPPARRLPAEAFDAIYRLRETGLVVTHLEKEFTDAQTFYRENQFDTFLDLDPWSLPLDQLSYLNHFLDAGFFSAEREILIAVLENRLNRSSAAATRPAGPSRVAERLDAAAATQESRLDDLRLAIDVYRRGRDAQITVPPSLTPEQDQSWRAAIVQKLAVERRKLAELDRRISELQTIARDS